MSGHSRVATQPEQKNNNLAEPTHFCGSLNAHPITAALVPLHHPGFAVAGVPHTLKELHLPLKISHEDQPLSSRSSAKEGSAGVRHRGGKLVSNGGW